MSAPVSALVEELKQLRKGYGVEAIDVRDHIGPQLRRVAGVEPADTAEQTRAKVRALLDELVDQLAEGLRPVLRTTFNLDAEHLRYTKRVERHAAERKVDFRTVQRRIDPGIVQVAELAAARPDRRDAGAGARQPWRTTHLKVFLSFDLPVPEVYEIRRITALEDGLDVLDLGMTLTPPPGWTGDGSLEDLDVSLLHGGALTSRTMRSSNRVQFRLELPEPVDRFGQHEYAVRIKLPVERMTPLYACTPDYECDSFELGVRFRADRLPVRTWSLPGVSPLELDDDLAGRIPIRPDRFGEVRRRFTDLRPHLSYGIGWEPS